MSRLEREEGKDFVRAPTRLEEGDGNKADVQPAQTRGCRGLCTNLGEVYREKAQTFFVTSQRVNPHTCVARVNKGLLDPSNRDRLLSNVNFGIHLLHLYPASVIGLSNEPLK